MSNVRTNKFDIFCANKNVDVPTIQSLKKKKKKWIYINFKKEKYDP